jgi:uncharacterized membrane protein
MYWFRVLVVAPFWAMFAAQFFTMSSLSLINFVIVIIGLFKRKVSLTMILAAMVTSLFSCVLFSGLLIGGNYLIHSYTSFGVTTSENAVFWIFVVLSLWFMAEQFFLKSRSNGTIARSKARLI